MWNGRPPTKCGPAPNFNGQISAVQERSIRPLHAMEVPPFRSPVEGLTKGLSVPLVASQKTFLLLSYRNAIYSLLETNTLRPMKQKDIQQGTLALMVLKTLDVLGPLHGYGIARRIEQISGEQLALNQGTLYPLLLRLEQEGAIESEWGPSENNRRARFYRLTRAGRKQLQAELQNWQQTTDIISRFLVITSPESHS